MKPSERTIPSALIQTVDQITAQVMAGDLPIPGMVVGIHKQGYAPFNKAYGLADIEAETKATVDTSFYIGCTTRIFIAVSILQLMEQGKLSLDDPLTKFLPGCQGTASQVTVEHLLCHRSGLADEETIIEHLGIDLTRDYSAEERIAVVEKLYTFAKAKPGEEHNYSNSGYLVLALIVEQASGLSLGDYLHDNIIEPLGLTQTQHIRTLPEGLAVGHECKDGQLIPPQQVSASLNPYGAACLISTTSDLLLFFDALRNGRVISPESYALMTTVHSPDSRWPGAGYGLGMFIYPAEGEAVWIGHPGGMRGHMANLAYYSQQDLTVALTMNVFGMDYLGPLAYTAEAICAACGKVFAET